MLDETMSELSSGQEDKGQSNDVSGRLPFSYSKRNGILLEHEDGHLTAFYKPGISMNVISEVRRVANEPILLRQIDEQDFDLALAAAYQGGSSEAMQMVEGIGDDMDLASLADSVPETEDLLEQEDDAPIIRLINALLTESVKEGASDIHVETFEKRLVVRFRIDGVLREIVQPKRALAPLLVSRIKVMAKLDIAEKRVPQDGRIALRIAGREVDLRVSTMPSAHGERVVMRLLDKQASKLDLQQIGMSERDLKLIVSLIEKPHGIMLVTGPTGSGKTTTLYSSLSKLNDQSRNILTVEDPIEYNLPGIGQTPVNTKVDMTFARALKAILRQDPDVVMIGEIRDLETVEIAIQASLTGHMVLSTLHTNTAIGAVTRLQDMGAEPFLVASSLVGVLAQRLVRTLCVECKQPHKADEAECEFLGVDPRNPPILQRAVGCSECRDTGYKGRLGIYELVEIDENMRSLIHNNAGEIEMEKYARTCGPSMRQDGSIKVLEGKTTVEEVLRVTRGD